MRRFLSFVARDERHVLTPPSEDEFGYEQNDEQFGNAPELSASVTSALIREGAEGGEELARLPTDGNESPGAQRIGLDARKPYDGFTEPRASDIDESLKSDDKTSTVTEVSELVPPTETKEESESITTETKTATDQEIPSMVAPRSPHERATAASEAERLEQQTVEAAALGTVSHSPSPEVLGFASATPSSNERTPELSPGPEERLRMSAEVLNAFVDLGGISSVSREEPGTTPVAEVVNALRVLAETMVWADQHDPNLWDTFLECSMMSLLMKCLSATVPISRSEKGDRADDKEAALEISLANIRGTLGDHGSPKDRLSRAKRPAARRSKSTDIDGRRGSRRGSEHIEPVQRSFSDTVNGLLSKTSNGITDMGGGEVDIADDSALLVTLAVEIQSQVLQTLSIMIQSVFRQQSLLCMFSSNHINDILSFDFLFETDEMLGYFMSAVKTIALKLDAGLLQLFFDPHRNSFPLYSVVGRFYDHPEQMVRIAVRNVTLTIYALGDSEVLKYAARDEEKYLRRTVNLLAKLCGSVARAFELLLDDGREVRRTRSRTGIFRRSVRVSEVTGKLEEIENLCAYLGDVTTVSEAHLRPVVLGLITSCVFSPFFRPLASQASPRAIRLQRRWRITKANSETDVKPALSLFDAAARSLLLACMLTFCKSSQLGRSLVREISRSTREFEDRHVLHALKSMAADISGTERVTFVTLCAMEAFIACDHTTREIMSNFKYDFHLYDPDRHRREEIERTKRAFLDIGLPDRDDLEHRKEEPMLMTLSEFEAPLTPSNSVPSTPTYASMSPDVSSSPRNGLARASSNASLSNDGSLSFDRSDSDGILSSFQLGEASLREAISSIALVVRGREVRTLRVIHAICRIVTAVGMKTKDYNTCVDVTKIILDELAGVINSFLKNKRTTIVSIEKMFESFRFVAESEVATYSDMLNLEIIVSPDRLPKTASDFPKGAGKRRRASQEDATPPTEVEDALTFFVTLHAYEQALESAGEINLFPSLSQEVRAIMAEYGLEDSYLDKRDALGDLAKAVVRHGEVEVK